MPAYSMASPSTTKYHRRHCHHRRQYHRHQCPSTCTIATSTCTIGSCGATIATSTCSATIAIVAFRLSAGTPLYPTLFGVPPPVLIIWFAISSCSRSGCLRGCWSQWRSGGCWGHRRSGGCWSHRHSCSCSSPWRHIRIHECLLLHRHSLHRHSLLLHRHSLHRHCLLLHRHSLHRHSLLLHRHSWHRHLLLHWYSLHRHSLLLQRHSLHRHSLLHWLRYRLHWLRYWYLQGVYTKAGRQSMLLQELRETYSTCKHGHCFKIALKQGHCFKITLKIFEILKKNPKPPVCCSHNVRMASRAPRASNPGIAELYSTHVSNPTVWVVHCCTRQHYCMTAVTFHTYCVTAATFYTFHPISAGNSMQTGLCSPHN